MVTILNRRSSSHQNHCEDNYWLIENDQYIVGAVLDGCSTGYNSHWASQTIKYIFHNAEKTISTISHSSLHGYCDFIISCVLQDMVRVRNLLKLSDMNFLSTIVFFIYEKETKHLFVKFFGDGAVFMKIDEEWIEIDNDENNIPHYLAYQMNSTWEEFIEYLNTRKVLEYDNVTDFSICSDGIYSLCNLKNGHLDQNIAIGFLVKDLKFQNLKNGLIKKFNILTNRNDETKMDDEHYWWDIKDDLTIIRYATL